MQWKNNLHTKSSWEVVIENGSISKVDVLKIVAFKLYISICPIVTLNEWRKPHTNTQYDTLWSILMHASIRPHKFYWWKLHCGFMKEFKVFINMNLLGNIYGRKQQKTPENGCFALCLETVTLLLKHKRLKSNERNEWNVGNNTEKCWKKFIAITYIIQLVEPLSFRLF